MLKKTILIYNYSQYPEIILNRNNILKKKINEIVNKHGVAILYVIKNVKGIM